MYYGAEEADVTKKVEAATDNRGVVDQRAANLLRQYRSAEEWQRYDTIVIGKGASKRDPGWFENWTDLSNASELQWFSGRASGVGGSFANQTTERADWAQDLHMTSIEFVCDPFLGEFESQPLEENLVPLFFSKTLPDLMSVRVILSDSDEIAKAPASHFPGRYGHDGFYSDSSSGPTLMPANNGAPGQSGWRWVVPITLAAKSRLTVSARIDEPAIEMLRALPDPGTKLIPQPDGTVVEIPNWYKIRVTHSGPRYLQLRGARQSS